MLELQVRNQSQSLYTRALTQAYRNHTQLYDPSVWQLRDPEVEEKMLRDADIAHAVGYRRHLIAGRQWDLQPKSEVSDRGPMACYIGKQLLGGIKHFTDARLNLARAFFSGARFAYIHGESRKLSIGDGVERTWWVPSRLEDQDKRMYRIVPGRPNEGGGHWERWDVWDGDWRDESAMQAKHTIRHVYQDDQGQLGYGRALREALGWWWYAKEHVFLESIQAVERFGQGLLTMKIDGARSTDTGLPNTQLIDQHVALLEDMRARHVLVYDSADQIEHIQTNGSGWELINTIRDELKSTIFTLVLGANMTTSANEGGSYALAEIQENSTEALVQYDRETLEETLTDDLLGCIWWRNYANLRELGIQDEKPRFSIVQEKKNDPKERADVAAVLSGMGLALSKSDLYEQTGFSEPEAGEDVLEGQSQTQPMLPGFGDVQPVR